MSLGTRATCIYMRTHALTYSPTHSLNCFGCRSLGVRATCYTCTIIGGSMLYRCCPPLHVALARCSSLYLGVVTLQFWLEGGSQISRFPILVSLGSTVLSNKGCH